MNKLQFHSLDSLRFFAFLKVYFLHIPIQASFPIFSFLKSGGGIGVSFFFVLSGFLISYLLIYEKQKNNRIEIKNFLIRRSLRIWPLFFLIIFLVFLLPVTLKNELGLHMNGGGYNFDWKYSFTFLENYKMLLVDNIPITTPLSVFWSLCIEEHFYIFWLIIIVIIPIKFIFRFFIFCILLAWVSRFIEIHYFTNTNVLSNDLFTNLDYFSSGGILGYLVSTKYNSISIYINKIPLWIKHSLLLFIILVVIFQNILFQNELHHVLNIFKPTIIAIIFTILIAIFIPVDSKISIKSKALNYLGKISYGLYVYHLFFIHIVFQAFLNNKILIDNWITLVAYIIITLGITILISIISYHYFEKKFLILRDKLTKR